MRALVPGLPTPRPLIETMPGLYQEDALAGQLTAAFDAAIAPVYATLDNLAAYVDPHVAPEDFLEWLAGWVGAVIDENWDESRRRAAVAQAASLYASRGTALGLARLVELVTDGAVEIVENGATAWSVDAAGPLPGSASPTLTVRVRVANPSAVDKARLDRLVAAAKPAHVPHVVEVGKA